MASQQEFPTLGNEGGPRGHHHNPAVYHEDHRRPWDADERSYAGGGRAADAGDSEGQVTI